jgi:hypothetical protein
LYQIAAGENVRPERAMKALVGINGNSFQINRWLGGERERERERDGI